MEKTELGQTGIMVSRLGLGTVKFGRNESVKYPEKFKLPDEKSLENLLFLAKDLGINLIDTAPAYGIAEERLGRLLKNQREDWVIIGKAGEEFESGASRYDFSPDHFEMSLHRTLERLKTDYLDVLLVHSDGSDVRILSDQALIKKLVSFKSRGLVRAVGASTKTIDGGLKALQDLDLVMATPEQIPLFDYALRHKKGVVLKKILGSGHKPVEDSMKAAFAHPGVDSAIIGTITPQHLREDVQAAGRALFSSAASRG